MADRQGHHVIPQYLALNQVIQALGYDVFSIENVISLPATNDVGNPPRESPHTGGHLRSYYAGIERFLGSINAERAREDPNYREAKANELNRFVGDLKEGLRTGHVFTNTPLGWIPEQTSRQNEGFFAEREARQFSGLPPDFVREFGLEQFLFPPSQQTILTTPIVDDRWPLPPSVAMPDFPPLPGSVPGYIAFPPETFPVGAPAGPSVLMGVPATAPFVAPEQLSETNPAVAAATAAAAAVAAAVATLGAPV